MSNTDPLGTELWYICRGGIRSKAPTMLFLYKLDWMIVQKHGGDLEKLFQPSIITIPVVVGGNI